MRIVALSGAFVAGFILSTVIGLTVVMPMHDEMRKVDRDSDVYRPLEGALGYIEQSAAEGDCKRAAAQLHLLNTRFAEFRAGGPGPSQWWQEVIDVNAVVK